VSLTDVGERFYEGCETIFLETINLESIAASYSGECAGNLRLGASDNICNYLIPKFIRNFLKRHPKVNLKLFAGTSTAIKTEIMAERAELGLFYTPLSASESFLESERLGLVKFDLVIGNSIKGIGDPFRVDDFSSLEFVGSMSQEYGQPYPALKMLNTIGIRPVHFIETNNQETQKRLVMGGCGFSIIPRPMIRKEVESGKLRTVETPKLIGEYLHLVQRKGRLLSKPAAAFKKRLISELDASGWFEH
jgi:DNA-binding transcriptional LysR family regulator